MPGPGPSNLAGAAPAPPAPAQNSQSILDALANLARQNTSAPPGAPAPAPPPTASYNVPPAAAGLPQPVSSSSMPHAQLPPQPAAPYPGAPQPAAAGMPFALSQILGQNGSTPNPPAPGFPLPNAAFPGAPGAGGAPGNMALDPQQQQQILLVKALADQGVPFDKIPALLQSLSAAGATGIPGQQPPPPGGAPQPPYGGQPAWGAQGGRQDEARDWRGGYNDAVNSPGNYGRSRSRSPDRGWGGRMSPRGRDRGEYGRDTPPRGRDGGRRGGEYRNRSPGRRRGQTPPPASERYIKHDPAVPSGSIKVLSRTLFVGGVT